MFMNYKKYLALKLALRLTRANREEFLVFYCSSYPAGLHDKPDRILIAFLNHVNIIS